MLLLSTLLFAPLFVPLNAWLIRVLRAVLLVAVILVGTSGVFVRLKLAGVSPPVVPVVTNVPDIVLAVTDT